MQLAPENVRLARLAAARSAVRELKEQPPAGLEEWLELNRRRTRQSRR